MKKRILSILLIVLMVLTMMPAVAVADTLPTASEYASAAPAAASGTDYKINDTDKTLTIKTAKGAAFWSANSASYLDYNVKLDADIDIGEFLWSPVGSGFGGAFTGDFDGQGHSIANLTVKIVADNYAGLFGTVKNSKVRNLCIGSGNLSINNQGTDFDGYAGGITGYNFYGTISNCCSHTNITCTDTKDLSVVGGIIGCNVEGNIQNCYSTGSITAVSNGNAYTGGICGDSDSGSLVNCYYLTALGTKGIGHTMHTNPTSPSFTATGCGTFSDNSGTLTEGTAAQFSTDQTLSNGSKLLTALNGWVNLSASNHYYTWKADSTSSPINGGYPVFSTILDPTPSFTAVTSIKDVPVTANVGNDLTLSGTVDPAAATNKTIAWSVKNKRTTGATIEDGKLKTTATGMVTVTATITNGATASSDYTQDFDITVKPALSTASEYASAAPAAATGTDYELNDTDKTLTIKTAKGAAFWSANSANYFDYNVKLDADIDVSQFLWKPVGPQNKWFAGNFDGQGHTITGLTVNEDLLYVGLFGAVNEVTIKNIGLIDSSITSACTGGSGVAFAGGIVGFADGGIITNCYNTGAITSNNSNQFALAGGIAGLTIGTITNCYNTGTVMAHSDNYDAEAYGIGRAYNGVVNCYNTGTVTANADKGSTNVGGITAKGCNATNCYYRSDCVTGTVDNNGTSLIDAQMKAAAGEPDAMIDKLNGWVNDSASTDYYTWKADSASNPANGGYPTFRTGLEPIFKAVTNITQVPTTAAVGIDLTLSGTVVPTNATNKTIAWSLKNAGNTGATLADGKLKTKAEGTVTVTATITKGATESSDYTQDFNITVKPAIATVSGQITAYDDSPVSNAAVIILVKSGNIEATTDASGNYSIANVPYGIHNIVVRYTVNGKEVKLYEGIVVNNSGVTKDIKLNAGSRDTSVVVGSDTPLVAVDRLGYQYDANLTPDEITSVDNGGTATIKLVAIKKAATEVSSDEGLIGTIATGKTLGYFIDLRVLKTVIASDNSTVTSEQPQTTLANIISVSIPIPTEMQGKDGISVYRVHNGVAQALQKDTPDGNGEYFTISPDGKYVTAYVKNFSTYAIGYTGSGTSGGSSGGGGGSSYSYNTITATTGEGGSISPSGSVSVRQGLSKTFTFTPASGYQIGDVVIDDKSVGVKSSYTFENVQKSHTLKVTFKKSENTTQKTEGGFKDVTQKDWFYDSVMNAVEKGWFKGISDTTFGPSLSTNRGMIATALWRMEKEPNTTATAIFKDVENGSWYYNGISWAQGNKIVEGYGNSKFGPQDNITREQMAAILYRYATCKGYDTSKTSGLNGFTDADSISQYAKVSMGWAVENGLISGKGQGILDPKKGATRGEVATILTRFNNLFQK